MAAVSTAAATPIGGSVAPLHVAGAGAFDDAGGQW
jgi:hypothetical protein